MSLGRRLAEAFAETFVPHVRLAEEVFQGGERPFTECFSG
jgi:hypothetical protein